MLRRFAPILQIVHSVLKLSKIIIIQLETHSQIMLCYVSFKQYVVRKRLLTSHHCLSVHT